MTSFTFKTTRGNVATFPGFTWKIGGEAGFGIMTTGVIFSKTCTRFGFHIFDYVEYPSLIRGGHNVMETHFSSQEVFSQEKGVDLLVALNRETVDLHKDELKEGAGIIFDPEQFNLQKSDLPKQKVNLFPVPLKKIVQQIGAPKIMENNVALGASVALFGLDLKVLFSVIEDVFKRKGREIIEENQKAAQAGHDYAKTKFRSFKKTNDKFLPRGKNFTDLGEGQKKEPNKKPNKEPNKKPNDEEKLVITGNEAIGLGAIAAGCKFYAAYPMTPSSSILHYLANKAESVGMVVRHAEDEIGVINEAIGASFAGVRAMIGTSGGGFALMNEAVALAGLTETPLVIVVAQRPGPATGMPTWTEQGDLQFIIRSGHGEFPKIVLAPGDVEETFWLTVEAFNLADIYQTPVFIASDKYLSESHKSVEITNYKLQITNYKFNRGKLETVKRLSSQAVKSYPRYKITDDGISPRILPGTPGFYFQANSYEHVENGHTSENSRVRIEQVNKRNRKVATYLKNHFQMPKFYGPKKAEITLVGWGSTKMPVLQALYQSPFNFLHFTHLWPMDGERIREELKKYKRLVLIENNSWGQFGQLIRQETGIEIKDKLLKYNGRPFYPEEILENVKNL